MDRSEHIVALTVAGAAISLCKSCARHHGRRRPPARLPTVLVDAYLARLDLSRPVAPTLDALNKLVAHHVDRVAYEDLDIHLGRAPSSLDPEHTASRIALEGRGGYCFQLGGAFASLLTSLGFIVSMHRASVRNTLGEDGAGPPVEGSPEALQELNHLAVVVRFSSQDGGTDRLYLADVGLGDGPCQAMPLEEGRFDDGYFQYSIERIACGWRFVHDQRGSFSYFDLVMSPEVGIEAFERAHHRLSTDPGSSFVKTATVQRRSADEVIILKRCLLTRIGGGTEREATELLEDEETWLRCLRETFNLTGFAKSGNSLDGVATGAKESAELFQKVCADYHVFTRCSTRKAKDGEERREVSLAESPVAVRPGPNL